MFGKKIIDKEYFEQLEDRTIQNNMIQQRDKTIKSMQEYIDLIESNPVKLLRGRSYSEEICDEMEQTIRACRK